MATDKKRIGYSFSLKKTDNPIIKEFITAQDNFSETMRFLIIKYCMENGIENVSSKLNDLIYSLAYSNTNNNSNQTKRLNDEEKEVKNIVKNNSIDEISADKESIKEDNENIKEEIKKDIEAIPKCYE